MNDDRAALDGALVRRRYARAAPAYRGAAVLVHEVERRMMARLDYIRQEPARILDAGCGPGIGWLDLQRRYPRAELIGVDATPEMLRQALTGRSWFARARDLVAGRAPRAVCADMRALPIKTGSVGMVWSNLALACTGDPLPAFREFQRVLAPGGLLMFSTYGPDTLKELRAAFSSDDAPHVHSFIDMHDLGDMLGAGGFAAPVMDMEIITLTYPDVAALAHDMRATGQTNALSARRRGLTGKGRWRRMTDAYETMRRGGRVPASFEIVYGHAWKAEPRIANDGRAIVKVDWPKIPESRAN